MIPSLLHHPALDVPVDCAGERHRLHWQAGELTAPDHDDAEGERALAALGGATCACVDLLDGWARHSDDLDVLVLVSRGPPDPLTPAPPDTEPAGYRVASGLRRAGAFRRGGSGGTLAAFSAGATANLARLPDPEADLYGELVTLLDANGTLAERLALTVAATWAERQRTGDARVTAQRAAMTAALYGRVTCTVRHWLARPDLAVEVEMTDAAAAIAWTAEGVVVRLPFEWIVEVWGRGVAIVADRFALRAAPTPRGLRLDSVGASLDDPGPVTITIG